MKTLSRSLRLLRRAVGRLPLVLADLFVLACAFFFSYQLRFEFVLADKERAMLLLQLPLAILWQWACMLLCGTYRRMWRFFSLVDLPPFMGAFALSGTGLFLYRALLVRQLPEGWMLPYSIVLLSTILGGFAVVFLRVFRRGLYELAGRYLLHDRAAGRRGTSRVVLIGAGAAGVMVARELRARADSRQKIVGFLDDDPAKAGSVVYGIPVLGPARHVFTLAQRKQIDEAVIAIANAPRHKIARIVRHCRKAGIVPRIIPALHEIVSGAVSVGAIRSVDIVDLLGRDVVNLESGSVRDFVRGRRVLVTGAGGSIGSEIVRQIARLNPAKLVMLDQSEWALYEINRELAGGNVGAVLRPVIADIADGPRMDEVFREERPEIVLHAAAYKHVPMMEMNVREAVRNNVLGTRLVARLAGTYGADVFVMISTDKAVNPTSVMGTTKRVAEKTVREQGMAFPKTRYVSVRFGNVLGSTGSVIPLFREQIRRGGPVTVTHPDMRRYFMTIPEATSLVLQAAAIGKGGEIFVLDMGTPVKIDHLAREMIRLSGLTPDVDIRIVYTGLRPGEKLFEELSVKEEDVDKTAHPKIFTGRIAPPVLSELEAGLEELQSAMDAGDEDGMRKALGRLVPEAKLSSAMR
ncbi:MAG: polysaccharide biosynthesis protein [Kiritimatiellae bacterium]|nr:polysaccharide biosynthesis protein [Kiritimatiellia bacterium]